MAKKIKYQTVQVSEKNKEELERIRRELERFHKKRFSLDVAVGHILKIYNYLMKDKTAFEHYLQEL